jgi:hypothetical protein
VNSRRLEASSGEGPQGKDTFLAWEAIPALTLVAGLLLWVVPTLADHRVLDLGMAYNGGVEAWKTGHPERIHTWMSTPFLGMVMAVVSRCLSMAAAERFLTLVNLLLLLGALWGVFRELRPRVPRAWWWAALSLAACFPPLISTLRWKQFNLIALFLALLGTEAARKRRPLRAGSLVALSVCTKPLIVLLPLGFLAHRGTRKTGLWTLGGIVVLTLASQAFLAWRSSDPSQVLSLTPLSNFSEKAEEWIPHVGNFSPVGLLARGAGRAGVVPWERLTLRLGVVLLALAAWELTKRRGGASWDLFGFACLLSPMLSPVAWSHYQIVLAPLLLVLAYRFVTEGASPAHWALLVFSYGLSALAMTPLMTVPGGLSTVLGWGYETIEREVPVLAAAQFAQYFLLVTGLSWYPGTRAPEQTL